MKKNDVKIFVLLFIFTCIIFLPWIVHHYSTDSFMICQLGYKNYAIEKSLLDGRVFMGIISFITEMFNAPILIYNSILLILALAVSCVDVIILKNIILREKSKKNIWQLAFIVMVCYYTIFHFLYIANLNYAEGFVMALSIMFYILAADNLINKQKKYIGKTLMYLILGVFMYQATISAFYICVILFAFIKNNNNKELIKTFGLGGLLGLIAVGFNILEIKIVSIITGLEQDRFGTLLSAFEYIYFLIRFILSNCLTTANLFPKYLYIIFIFLIEDLVLFKLISEKKSKLFIEQIILIIFSIVLSYIPSIISSTSMNSGRIRFSMGMTIGILFIHLIVKAGLLDDKRKIINNILIIIFVCYGLINTINYINLIKINGIINELDTEYAYEIDEYIAQYEATNNIKVKNISPVFTMTSPSKAYYIKETLCTNIEIGVSAAKATWSAIGCIEYYTNRNLVGKMVNDDDKEDILEQIKMTGNDYLCIDDTLYLVLYEG